MTEQKSARDVMTAALLNHQRAVVGPTRYDSDLITLYQSALTASGHLRDPDSLRLEGWRKMKEAALNATPDTGPYAEDVAQAAYFCGVMDYNNAIGALTPPAEWAAQPDLQAEITQLRVVLRIAEHALGDIEWAGKKADKALPAVRAALERQS